MITEVAKTPRRRFPVALILTIREIGGQPVRIEGTTESMSSAAALCVLAEPLAAGAATSFSVQLSRAPASLVLCRGWVVRSEPVAPTGFRITFKIERYAFEREPSGTAELTASGSFSV